MLIHAELRRYARQIVLPAFGPAAQERLKRGRVLVIGAGGLGCPALLYLGAAGVGHITLVDPDHVDATNLQRQVLFAEADVGRPKVAVAAAKLQAQNPFLSVTPLPERFRRDNALDLVRGCDVVIDGSDNFATRYLVNDACVMMGKPFVYGAVEGFAGQLSVFNWQGGPTYRCLFPVPPPPALAPNCAAAGVLGVVPGAVGTWQAAEAIKLLTGVGQPLSGKLLLWDALTMQVQTVSIEPDPRRRPILELPADEAPPCASSDWEIGPAELRALLATASVQLVDVRDEAHRDEVIPSSTHLALAALEDLEPDESVAELRPDRPTVVYCSEGLGSLHAVALLRGRHGFLDVRSLRGGMRAWSAQS